MRAARWLPTVLGIVALIGFTVVTAIRLMPGHSAPRALPPPAPPFTLPGTTSGPPAPISLIPASTISPSASIPPTEAGKVTHRDRPASPSRTVPVVIKPPAPVSGKYQVLNSYGDSFIAEVLLTNRTGAEQNWVLTLTYPGNLRTSWLESLPQPALTQRGHTFTWTSSVPLAAGATAQMRFHFDRAGGSDTPDACAVNGSVCSR